MKTQVAKNGSDCKFGVHEWEEMDVHCGGVRRQRCIHCGIQRIRYWENDTWTDWKPAKARKP